jgi:CRP-like cAMP-binding protein
MSLGELGRRYGDGEVIMRQGDPAGCMYVVQSGTVEVLVQGSEGPMSLAVLGAGDVFGEMALFTGAPRSATVRVLRGARVLTVDRKTLLRRVHEDPSLAFRILQKMSERIQVLDLEVARLQVACVPPSAVGAAR